MIITAEPNIHQSAKINKGEFGAFTQIDERVRVTESKIGDYSYILHDSEVIYSEIGKFCAIAPFTRINPGNHPYWRAGLSNFTYRSSDYGLGENDQQFFQWRRNQKVTIGHDVWIGQGVLVMPGLTIGTGAVIGGGAVVTKDVAPYTIVAGSAAKVIKRRFSEKVEESLLRISWWDWSAEEIKEAMSFFRKENIEDFCRQFDPKFEL
ncbi:hypothetical protein SAMN04489724_0584 [Algoriphagus locisalis]|uniref:Phosphonate metabolim protein, transferase hexapeptide repeat family n=1 Tax=Algoriphagus locisalis TaxID=305507 RepID=A0A1I6XN39_9BACT|nr:chloramphenicol acetyltransferase [Algoriphagus locisalis]SFT39808.1 hypothetical protein SAMN04489724_0584 [Algoriphagus locisalis]